jgi:uncharacterized protein YodC (DUF2158 family)
MTIFKSGDLVLLKSGGPVMTVDTVNTDILDDNKITGVLCVWFVGDKFERVRFDHRALKPASIALSRDEVQVEEVGGEYKLVLDEMAAAMNVPEPEDSKSKPVTRKSRRASEAAATPSSLPGAAGD